MTEEENEQLRREYQQKIRDFILADNYDRLSPALKFFWNRDGTRKNIVATRVN